MSLLAIPPRRPLLGGSNQYLLLDRFEVALAAGSVNGTMPTPGPGGPRTVVDTENKLSIANGVLTFAGGKVVPAWGDPQIAYPTVTRVAGKALLASITAPLANTKGLVGFDNDGSGIARENSLLFGNTSLFFQAYENAVVGPDCGAFVASTAYQVAIVLRATGAFYFVKGGVYTNWTLLWVGNASSVSPLYPETQSNNAAFTADNLRIPQRLVAITPLASDSFNRANGAAGSTDGAGTQEVGGGGLAWSAVGTWAIATNAANCSALSSGVGILTCDPSQSDVIAAIDLTVTAGAGGLVLRYVDTDNYLYAYHDGTNAALIKRVAGVESNVVAPAAATYGAGRTLVVDLSGTAARLYYNNALVGTGAVPASTASKHGLWTNNIAPTFDNFRVWAKSGYSVLDTL